MARRDGVRGLNISCHTPLPPSYHTLQTWEETDVDIKILYCGICASDSHVAGAGWAPPKYPIVSFAQSRWVLFVPSHCLHVREGLVSYRHVTRTDSVPFDLLSTPNQVVGHEIVGEAVRVGKEVKHVKVGDIVGVGAQCGSCLSCGRCQTDNEQYCDRGHVGTYNSVFYQGEAKGDRSQGGYSNFNRSPGHFVVKIPDGMDPALAAPMLCGGVTVYR